MQVKIWNNNEGKFYLYMEIYSSCTILKFINNCKFDI